VSSAQDVANLGLARPPLVYVLALALGAALEFVKPLPCVPPELALPLGIPLVVIAIALFVWSVVTFKNAGTPVPGNQPTTTIVGAGPYAFSRNPIYLAFSLLQLGIAVWVNSVWLLATLVAAMALMHFVVIGREEAYLERKFGAQYLDYKRAVRRWL
jgi:protein-S-isoprenylcysteine O-methyltransferase Ste14